MSNTWDDGTKRSQNNAFCVGFIQPVLPPDKGPENGRDRPGYIAPREIIKCDAVNSRLALNNAGKIVSTSMGLQKPNLSIATDSDKKVIRKRKAAI